MATKKKQILTIEDDLVVRKALANFLEGVGYSVDQAETGKQGVERFKQIKPDLVITDLRLPELDGLKVLEKIRRISPDTPVIVFSGMGTLADAIEALRLGASDYITKPVTDLALIKHTVEKALERVKLVKENRAHQEYLEKEVERKTAELHQAQKLEAIGTLAGGIAHDFNNILAVIIGHAELAQLSIDRESELADDLRQILKASDRAKNLVLQILNFGRKNKVKRMPLQTFVIVKETIKMLRATFPSTAQIHFKVLSKNLCILADPVELHQVLTNLCTNALHALPDQQGNITIELEECHIGANDDFSTICEGEYLKLVVKDDGGGIEAEALQKIFDPFFTTKEKGEGTGLGLSVVNEIVTNCHGEIKVESEVGVGTTFSIYFPLYYEEKIDEHIIADERDLPSGTENILFIDDEVGLVSTVERMLNYLGYKPTCFSSSIKALKYLETTDDHFDLIISDQSMPKVPGNILVERIKDLMPDVPILLCTGYSSVVDKAGAIEVGAKDLVMKPIGIEELAVKIRDVLDNQAG